MKNKQLLHFDLQFSNNENVKNRKWLVETISIKDADKFCSFV